MDFSRRLYRWASEGVDMYEQWLLCSLEGNTAYLVREGDVLTLCSLLIQAGDDLWISGHFERICRA